MNTKSKDIAPQSSSPAQTQTEQAVMEFISLHFPNVITKDHTSEKAIIRVISYILRYASQYIHNIQYQGAIAAIFGLVNLYGIRGAASIILKLMKKGKPSTT